MATRCQTCGGCGFLLRPLNAEVSMTEPCPDCRPLALVDGLTTCGCGRGPVEGHGIDCAECAADFVSDDAAAVRRADR